MGIQIIQDIIDILRGKKKTPGMIKREINSVQKNFSNIEKKLIKKVQKGKKIRVGFFVILDSVFQSQPVFQKMLNDDIFEPFIVVIPDTSRGDENMFKQMDKSYKTFSAKYKNVYKSYDEDKQDFIDFTKQTDIGFFNTPYDFMTHNFYSIEYAGKNNILTIYMSYTLITSWYLVKTIPTLPSISFCWRIFTDTEFNHQEYLEYSNLKDKNLVLTGYAKMDALAGIKREKRQRKKIIIAPHHSMGEHWKKHFNLSNFLKYSDFFLELPKLYPDIDFVFRPHPLWRITLERDDIWGKVKTEEYLNKLTSYQNIEYQYGGEYFDTFVNSDGIIHDCSSFLAEYLYTGNPCCYMIKENNEFRNSYTNLGEECLKQYYLAFNKEDIIKYIEEIILGEKDTKENERKDFANKYLKLNYPNVSDNIIKYIKETLSNKNFQGDK